MSNGVYPFEVKRVLDTDTNSYDTNIRKAANRLIKLENKLLGKEKKKRKRNSENNDEKTDVPQKRRKVSNTKEKSIVEENASAKNDVTQEELDKFIEQSEASLNSKLKKNKKKVNKQPRNNDNAEKIEPIKENVKKRKRELNNDKTEVKKKKRDRKQQREQIINNIECVFERNSGTWVVYDTSQETKIVRIPSKKTEVLEEEMRVSAVKKESPSTYSKNPENSEFVTSSYKDISTLSTNSGNSHAKKESPSKNPSSEQDSPKSG